MARLHLGCGDVYKPQFINIDRFNKSLADIRANVDELPFKDDSVNVIEAYHLIEHFDYIHCKYLLSEWFRVLKPGGELIIETPDLEESFKKFSKGDSETKEKTLRWLYGIDSPGLQHKTGFTFELLKNLLSEIGFEKITKEEPKTHTYEPGLRVRCKKSNWLYYQLFANFRAGIIKAIGKDSYFLTLLENKIQEVLEIFKKEFEENKKDCLRRILVKLCICNPSIAKSFLESVLSFNLVDEKDLQEERKLVEFLEENEFHKRLMSLWAKRRKNVFKVNEDFREFISSLESLLDKILNKTLNEKEALSYILSLETREIKIFTPIVVLLEAKKLFNLGIKRFHERNFSIALKLFKESLALNPANPLVYWNISRLLLELNPSSKEKMLKNYEIALSLMKDKNIKSLIKVELEFLKNEKLSSIPRCPIAEI